MDDSCDVPGLTLEFEFVVDGSFAVKSHGPDGLLFYSEHATSSLTLTNPANGLSTFDKTRVVTRTCTSSTTATAP